MNVSIILSRLRDKAVRRGADDYVKEPEACIAEKKSMKRCECEEHGDIWNRGGEYTCNLLVFFCLLFDVADFLGNTL
jgi:hypothetical protein